MPSNHCIHTGSFALLVLLVAMKTGGTSMAAGPQDPPPYNGPPGVPCAFTGPLVHVPSGGAGTEGLLVRISPPVTPRYPEGAPIAVHMLAAAPTVAGSIACLSEQGFVDVGFLCPGEEYRAPDGAVARSGGTPLSGQVNWERCIEPLADVLAFATGNLRSLEGKPIQAYAPSVPPLTENVGIIGWSFGGNLAVHAMARYGERFRNLKWYASWETPIRSPVDDGRGTMFERNPFYDEKTDTIDFARLRYDPGMPIWTWPVLRLSPAADWPRGGLFLDGHGGGVFRRDTDFAFWVDVEPGAPMKVFYSPEVTVEAQRRNVFGDRWPAHIASVREVEAREERVNAVRRIPAAVKKLPDLAVLVFESERHHVGGFGGGHHLDALVQSNAWLDAKVRWMRFNPDRYYVELIAGKMVDGAVQFPAQTPVTAANIAGALEPASTNGPIGMRAAACELADRTHFGLWQPVLTKAPLNEPAP